jgi:hypothetical protein
MHQKTLWPEGFIMSVAGKDIELLKMSHPCPAECSALDLDLPKALLVFRDSRSYFCVALAP